MATAAQSDLLRVRVCAVCRGNEGWKFLERTRVSSPNQGLKQAQTLIAKKQQVRRNVNTFSLPCPAPNSLDVTVLGPSLPYQTPLRRATQHSAAGRSWRRVLFHPTSSPTDLFMGNLHPRSHLFRPISCPVHACMLALTRALSEGCKERPSRFGSAFLSATWGSGS